LFEESAQHFQQRSQKTLRRMKSANAYFDAAWSLVAVRHGTIARE
jgi:hypothetical protein